MSKKAAKAAAQRALDRLGHARLNIDERDYALEELANAIELLITAVDHLADE